MRVVSEILSGLPAPRPVKGQMMFWRVRFRLSDGGVSDVTVSHANPDMVVNAAIAKLRTQVKFFGEFEVEAKWVMDPPRRWYYRRAGRSMRNALGSLASLGVPGSGFDVPGLALRPQDTPVLCVGLVLLALSVAVGVSNWMRSRKDAALRQAQGSESKTEWARQWLREALLSFPWKDTEASRQVFLDRNLETPRLCPSCDQIASSVGPCWCCGFESSASMPAGSRRSQQGGNR